MKLQPSYLPAYLAIILANLLPVYGAFLHRLFFFQIIYLFWLESVLLILFGVVRIILARGTELEGSLFVQALRTVTAGPPRTFGFLGKVWLIIKFVVSRLAILAFYLIFIIAFIFFQVTDDSHRNLVIEVLVFRNPFFNTALGLFLVSMTVQLISGFVLNGKYKVMSPINYSNFYDVRTLLLHIMIVGVIFVHKFFFEGRPYAAEGEVLYVGLFMFFKALHEVSALAKARKEEPQAMPMI